MTLARKAGDEPEAELFDLPRRHRLAHAFRVLRAAPAIRVGLRADPVSEREG